MKIILVKFLLISILSLMMFEIDFGKQDTGKEWRVVVDGVMGGKSTGEKILTDSSLLFTGKVSLENNGGFASIRSRLSIEDLSVYRNARIKYRLSGQVFAFTLAVDERFYIPNYKVKLIPSEEWTEVLFSLREFKEYRVGRATGNKISEEKLKEVIRLGFITDDKKETSFSFEVDKITFEK